MPADSAGSDPPIATDRLLLRRFRIEDAVPLHGIFADREAMRFWSTPPHETFADTEEFVRRTIAAQEAATADEFVVTRDGRIIGKVGLWRGNEIGFIFAPRAWGRGLAAEAVRALMARCAQRGIATIRADVDPRNERSLRLLKRLGFHETGMAERTLCIGCEWVDSVSGSRDLAPCRPVELAAALYPSTCSPTSSMATATTPRACATASCRTSGSALTARDGRSILGALL